MLEGDGGVTALLWAVLPGCVSVVRVHVRVRVFVSRPLISDLLP